LRISRLAARQMSSSEITVLSVTRWRTADELRQRVGQPPSNKCSIRSNFVKRRSVISSSF
jgi:hypothetical protein